MSDNYSAASGQGIYAGRYSNTPLSDFIAAMSSNSWAEYTGTNINEMTVAPRDGQLYGILETRENAVLTNWANKFCFDRANMVISGIGTAEGHISSSDGKNYSKDVAFDLKTNSFSVRWNPTDITEGHIYDGNTSIPLGGVVYRKGYSRLSKKPANTFDWEPSGYEFTGLAGPLGYLFSMDVFPQMGASGSLIVTMGTPSYPMDGRLIRFDIATGVRTVLGQLPNVGEYPLTVYVNGAVILGSGKAGCTLYRLSSDGTISTLIDSYAVELSTRSYGQKMLACPNGTDSVYTFTPSDSMVRRINTITGAAVDIGAYPAYLSSSANVVITSIQGFGAFAFWRGRGRAGSVTQSEFHIYKV